MIKKIRKILKRKDVAIFLSLVMLILFTLFVMAMFRNIEDNMGNVKVKLETNHGDIVIILDREAVPITVDNFLNYVKSGAYDGTVFHRVIDGFMIQGGGFGENGSQRETNSAIKLESDNGLTNKKGSVSMARTMDPNSATNQFFINLDDNSFLDYSSTNPGYAVFGEVVEGMDVVEEIGKVQTSVKHGMKDWPVEEVVILKATII